MISSKISSELWSLTLFSRKFRNLNVSFWLRQSRQMKFSAVKADELVCQKAENQAKNQNITLFVFTRIKKSNLFVKRPNLICVYKKWRKKDCNDLKEFKNKVKTKIVFYHCTDSVVVVLEYFPIHFYFCLTIDFNSTSLFMTYHAIQNLFDLLKMCLKRNYEKTIIYEFSTFIVYHWRCQFEVKSKQRKDKKIEKTEINQKCLLHSFLLVKLFFCFIL